MNKWRPLMKKLVIFGGASGLSVVLVMQGVPKLQEARRMRHVRLRPQPTQEELDLFKSDLTSRDANIKKLMTEDEVYDILVIGGGASGTGVALDSVSRGLKTCLVEKLDFASGTSSRSTKLIHGGVRYLQKAVFNLDLEQYNMVQEALSERANLLDIAPHTARPLPIMLPIYKLWQIPYYWAGIKMYDLVSGSQILKASYFLNKSRALELFPHLKQNQLKGALVYYDGQHDDARMCLDLAFTASRYGATIANYVEAMDLLKGPVHRSQVVGASLGSSKSTALDKETEKLVINGVRLKDHLTGKEFVVKAKCVVNATGPFTDTVRKLDNKDKKTICEPSSGVHLVLPNYYSPENMGLLDPSTTDGRVIFFLPWLGNVVAGTTDRPCSVTSSPSPTEEDVGFILSEIQHYLSPDIKVRRGDVLSVWSGIRPLVSDPNSKNTQSIARNHVIEVTDTNLITIAGGKWTTYRRMAEETVDTCIKVCGLQAKNKCITKGLLLDGAHGWKPNLPIKLVQQFGMDRDVAVYLASTYGGRSIRIGEIAKLTGLRKPIIGRRLHPDYPVIEAEVVWACREYACHAVDFIARRSRLAFLNVYVAEDVLPKVVDLMATELNWSKDRKKQELEDAKTFLRVEMGLDLKAESRAPPNFTEDERNKINEQFKNIDMNRKGVISLQDLRHFFIKQGEVLSESTLRNILSDIDLNKNGEIDNAEFLEFMYSLKIGALPHHSLKQVLDRPQIPVDRSGGGV